MSTGRHTTLSFTYKKSSVSRQLKPYIEEFTYTDIATGGNDEISITLDNQDKRFLMKWKPLKGAKMTAKINMINWDKEGVKKSFKCGTFVLDELSASANPSTFTIKGVSSPVKGAFKATERTKTYKKATIKSIANKIAKRAGIKLHYEADKINIKKIEQSKQTDAAFLTDLCTDYGLGIKIYNEKIVIFDEEKYEKKKSITTIKRKNGIVIDWDWTTTMQKTYTGAKVAYTTPSNNKKHKAKVGKKGRMLHATLTAFSKKDAKLKAEAMMREANKKKTTISLTVQPDPRLIASDTIKLSGFGKASGKYYIDEIEHNISRSSGYTMTIEAHKVNNNEALSNGGSGGSSGKALSNGGSGGSSGKSLSNGGSGGSSK